MSDNLSKHRAFTLMETILAVSLMALVLMAVHGALWSGMRTHRRFRQSFEREGVISSAMRLIAEDLGSVMLQADDEIPSLVGVSDVSGANSCLLRLRTNARVRPAARQMLVDYFLMPHDEQGGLLVRRSQPLSSPGRMQLNSSDPSGETPQDSPALYETVARGVRLVRFRYFDGSRWADNWDSAQRRAMPTLVEVAVEFEGSHSSVPQTIPVMVNSPLLTTPSGGAFP